MDQTPDAPQQPLDQNTSGATAIARPPETTGTATPDTVAAAIALGGEADAKALADRVQWRLLLEEYRRGNIDQERRPTHIRDLDAYLKEGGGFLTAPLHVNEEARLASTARYMAEVTRSYRQAGVKLDLDKYTRLASMACDAPVALLNFVDLTEQYVKSQYGFPSWQDKVMPRNQSLCSHTILKEDDGIFSVTDCSKDWRFAELDIVKGEEHIRWYAGVALRTPDGHNIGAICVVDTEPRDPPNARQQQALKDIAKMVMLELNPLTEELVRQRQERVLLSSISHELRAPLHGLLASTELLLDESSDSNGPSQNSFLQTIANCGNMLQDVIENVLSQRVQDAQPRDSVRSSKSLVDLPAFLEEVLDSTWMGKTVNDTEVLGQVEVFVRSNLRRTNVAYRIDRGEIGRIIMNVFGNGIKYTNKGNIQVKLSAGDIQPSSDGTSFQQRIRLVFQDTGKGIAASYLPQLFTPFVQEDSLSEGYGLGMSMVKELVERNGGKTQVNSVEGQGTTITVELMLDALPEIQPSPFAALRGKYYYASSHLRQNITLYKYVREICDALEMLEGDVAEADVILVKETEELVLADRMLQDVNLPTVLFTLQSRSQPLLGRSRAMLVQGPLGPYKLGRAIMAALNLYQPSSSTRRFSVSSRLRRPGISRHSSTGPVHESATTAFNLPNLKQEKSESSSSMLRSSSGHSTHSNKTGASLRSPLTSVSGISSLSLESDDVASTDKSPVPSSGSRQTLRPPLSHRPSSVPVPDSSRLHCLIVDDNPINLQILRTTLERLGLSCVVAENGLEGFLRYAEAHGSAASSSATSNANSEDGRLRPFDLVFMDVYMPHMNGIESTRKIRTLETERRRQRRALLQGRPRSSSDVETGATALPRTSVKYLAANETCTVVAISGGGEEEETEMKEAGADYFFQRPFTGRDLKQFLASFERDLATSRNGAGAGARDSMSSLALHNAASEREGTAVQKT